jgi:thymidylate kinase/endonuclease III-like uncharacterized protein
MKNILKKTITNLPKERLYKVIECCAKLPEVKQEVLRNHDDNRWWPKSVKDWRIRLLVAGWSTRVSYSMIKTYQSVVAKVNEIEYEELCALSESELLDIIRSLGLAQTRIDYFRSVESYITKSGITKETLIVRSNDELIADFAKNVKGSGYKVAQCAILYAKGYHCGIFPVDSGMKDMLGPCLGISLPSGSIANEVMRKQIEQNLNFDSYIYRELAYNSGYETLDIPENTAPIWWAHLVLIYFKRLYCNHHKPVFCPLRASSDFGKFIGSMCDSQDPHSGGIRHIILEGLDGAGKSTLAQELVPFGYQILHSTYKPNHVNIVEHYRDMIKNLKTPTILDRSFISEIVYGSVLRGISRIAEDCFVELLEIVSAKNFCLLYVHEELSLIAERLQETAKEHDDVLKHLDKLAAAYEQYIKRVECSIPVMRISPTKAPRGRKLVDFIIENISI